MVDNEKRFRPLAWIGAGQPGAPDDPLPEACPRCGHATVVPIVYGYPSGAMREAATEQRIVLGGCLMFDSAPRWQCTTCRTTGGSDPDGAA